MDYREAILSRGKSLATTTITLDDGQTVKARKLTQAEVETINRKYVSADKVLEGLRFIVSRTVLDDDGARVFKDNDMEALTEIDFATVSTIATEVSKFSGLNVPKT